MRKQVCQLNSWSVKRVRCEYLPVKRKMRKACCFQATLSFGTETWLANQAPCLLHRSRLHCIKMVTPPVAPWHWQNTAVLNTPKSALMAPMFMCGNSINLRHRLLQDKHGLFFNTANDKKIPCASAFWTSTLKTKILSDFNMISDVTNACRRTRWLRKTD